MRTAPLVLALVAALVGGAHVARAQEGLRYKPLPNWPQAGAPDYGTGAVSAVAVDRKGDVYVFQRAPHPVLVFNRQGKYLRSWGEGMFTMPHGCRFDAEGNLWLTDVGDHRVMKFTPEGRLLATYGEKDKPAEDETHFNKPADVAFGRNGDVYIADGYGNSRVVRLSKSGKFLGAWGRKGKGEGEFDLPHSIAVDPRGRVIVADRENGRIQLFTPEGRFLSQWPDRVRPYGLYLTPDQRLFITDGVNNTVSIWSLEGKELAKWGRKGSAAGELDLPHMVCVDDQGAVYVTEINGKRLQKFVRE